MFKRSFWVLGVGALLLALTLTGFAQNETAVRGNIAGVILDPSGAVIPGAKIVVTGPTGTKDTTTDNDGRFTFPLLTPGTYSLDVSKEGFRTAAVKGVEVVISKTSSVSISLQPGGSNETVEVTASAVTVDTTSTAVGANLSDRFYSNVPVARGVTGIFYASPGVVSGGGTGAGNPSIGGASGLENQYVADGVNITDGGFGGIGVYTRVYGSLSTGINLSFVKEVQVKTGGFEPQYGKSTGGIVQIVTKSGGNAYHGGVSFFAAPESLEGTYLQPDLTGPRLNEAGQFLHQQGYDVSGEIGGYIPGFKNNIFFFGSFNPTWNTQFARLADLHGTYPGPLAGAPVDLKQTIYNYAAKLTFKLSDSHQIESSVFGDPTRSNTSSFNNFTNFSDTTWSKLNNGTRNWVARYNGTLSPTWLLNSSVSWGHNYLTETPNSPDVYQIADVTGCGYLGNPSSSCRAALQPGTLNGPLGTPLSGTFTRQGLGYYEDTTGDNWAWNIDTSKVVNFLGSHTFSLGYRYERNSYAGQRHRSGASFNITPEMAADQGTAEMAGLQSDAAFQLRVIPGAACSSYYYLQYDANGNPLNGFQCPMMNVPGYGLQNVYMLQTRGEFGKAPFDTHGRYHAAYFNDAWTLNKYLTVNVGWRWEQQSLIGTPFHDFKTGQPINNHYTFTDNWSPRIGISIDPIGDKKTKIFGNFARYNYAIPLDMAIRSLSNELDFGAGAWAPVTDASGMVVVNPDNTLANPVLDNAHYGGSLSSPSISSTTAIAPGTKMQFLQEWVAGVERELPGGVVVTARWTDRRLKRIVEDTSGISPEAFQCCLNQNYLISNPSPSTDLFVNSNVVTYPLGGLPADCPSPSPSNPAPPMSGGTATDFNGNDVGDFCITNAYTANGDQLAGSIGSDGIPDGFWAPARIYKSIELELNKAFSKGWLMRTNYRWAQLSGNYEGAFRNDNGQSDPSISSLYDFTAGNFGLLGDQAQVGWLNTDRRHVLNTFLSYNFSGSFLKGLTLGTGVRIEGGTPISKLRAHPAYWNAGEIPEGGRGALGRTNTTAGADIHAEYAWKLTEHQRLKFGADLFNVTNRKTQTRVDQNADRSYLVSNADFLKPTQGTGLNPLLGYQRPFYARFNLAWVF